MRKAHTFSNTFCRAISGAVFLVMLAAAAVPVSAAVYVVTKTADTNDGICDEDCSLREAIAASNSSTGNDEINFDSAIFATKRTISLNGTELFIDKPSGALAINGPGRELLTISGNNASRVMWIYDHSRVFITSVTIRDGNGRNRGAGGGIANSGTLVVNDVTVSNSVGGTFAGGIANLGTLTVLESTITGNDGDLNGGGIYNSDLRATLTIHNSIISNNQARRDGGGIYNSGAAFISGTTISGNIASSPQDGGAGGGIHTTGFGNRDSSITVVNSTIANNDSKVGGGGIMNDGSRVELVNVTITGNRVTNPLVYYYGGGVVNFQVNYPGSVTARNSIIANNSSANGQAPDFGGILTSQGYNLIRDTNMTAFAAPPQTDIFHVDPLLAPLADNGGLTPTCALLPGSLAIDAVPDGSLPVDQRFFRRPANENSAGDVGAFEANSAAKSLFVGLSGRITLEDGRGLTPAIVSISDNYGNTAYASVNPLGYYRFSNLLAGKAYTIRVRSKRGNFHPKAVFAVEDHSNVNFSPTS